MSERPNTRGTRQPEGGQQATTDTELPQDAQRVVDLLAEAQRHEREGLGLTVAAGNRLATADQQLGQVRTAVAAAQGLVSRVNIGGSILGDPVTPAPAAPTAPAADATDATQVRPAATTAAQSATTMMRDDRAIVRRFGIAILAGFLTMLLTLAVWSSVVDDAKGEGGWADNGWIMALVAIGLGLGVAFVASSFGPDDQVRPVTNVTNLTLQQHRPQLHAQPVDDAATPDV